jgi:hypothetical protein
MFSRLNLNKQVDLRLHGVHLRTHRVAIIVREPRASVMERFKLFDKLRSTTQFSYLSSDPQNKENNDHAGSPPVRITEKTHA